MSILKSTLFAITLGTSVGLVSAAESTTTAPNIQYNLIKTESFGGVGITLIKQNSQLVISSVIEGSPADLNGLQKGDIILNVDGQDMDLLTMTETIQLMRGTAGQEMNLVVERKSDQNSAAQLIDFQIDRVSMQINQGVLNSQVASTVKPAEIKQKMQVKPQSQIFLNGKNVENESSIQTRTRDHVYSVEWGQSEKSRLKIKTDEQGKAVMVLPENAPYQAFLVDMNGRVLEVQKGSGSEFELTKNWANAQNVVRVRQSGRMIQ